MIKKIIIHCSDSTFGNSAEIDKWHKANGWRGIGYHYVILNGRLPVHREYDRGVDGVVEDGRPVDEQGAHCRGHNVDSIGICLIGRETFTQRQLFVALPKLLIELITEHLITVSDIHGHCEFNSGKTCPNLDMNLYRKFIREKLHD